MGSGQGWFESDEDYRSRVAQEADEKTIESSTGSSASQGWLESDEGYRTRISKEANECRVKDSNGEGPSQGWFESVDSYYERIDREANESTIKGATGASPSQGLFESDEAYDIRVRKEANEHIVNTGTGSSPSQGWFEGDHAYRSRIAHEARQIRASDKATQSASSTSYASGGVSGGSSTSSDGSGFGCGIILLIVIGLCAMIFTGNKNTTSSYISNKNGTVDSSETLYINTKQMKLRSGPGSKNMEIGRVNFGDAVIFYNYAKSIDGGTWVNVKVGNGEGWLNRKYLTDNQSEADKRYAVANRIESNQKSNSVSDIISTDTFQLIGKIKDVSEPQGSGGFWYFDVVSTGDNEKYGFGCNSQSKLYFRIQDKDATWSDGIKAMQNGANATLHFKNKDLDFFQRCSHGSKCDGSLCPISIEIN